LKILISTFTFAPNKDGVAEAAGAQAEAFLRRGWQVDIATEPTHPPRSSLQWGNARLHEFRICGSSYWRQPYRGEIDLYQKFLISGRWDVILFHAYLWSVDLALPILDSIPSKKVLVSHGYGGLVWVPAARFPFGLMVLVHSFWQSLRMLTWVKKFDRWVFLSRRRDLRAFYDHWLAEKIRHPGITVIPNGVEVSPPCLPPGVFRKQNAIPSSAPFFLCVANYSRRKDQGYAVRAFRQAAMPGSHLVFIGSEFNDSSARFQKEDGRTARSSPPGTIHWLQNVSREQTLAALAECDVVVLSANHEGQPFVLLEAMAAAKPWIARKAGCIQELPGGICVSSERRMAQAMRSLAENLPERMSLGQEGLQAAQCRFSRQTYGQTYCQMLEQFMNPRA